ncbi:hypothetical protein [Desulfovibrio sp. UCD-KL4C]|uniref:hypothetical protein n=1 Tax=Desulfovibrio sp. UCD-KL4C TaxID=2578120 RepID=UPI0025C3CCF9|nr:hypothetical protein [Desulfovibrio sp. UCD-KL4C]
MPLLGYQKKWINDETPVKFWEKSRRIGASFCDACDSALVAAKNEDEGGMSTYYISYNKAMTKQYVKDTAFWAKKIGLVASEVEEIVLDEDKDITIFQVRFASGHEVQGLSSNPSNLRSKKGRVRIDEAAFVDNLKEVLKAALALIMWGGNIGVLSTHNGEDSEFNELIEEIRAGKKSYSLHRTDLDEALEQGLYRTICDVKGIEWTQAGEDIWREELIDFYGEGSDEELYLIPSKSSGNWLNRNLIESCMDPIIPVLTWLPPAANFVDWPLDTAHREVRDWLQGNLRPILDHLPTNCRHYLGEDFGRTGDLSVDWPLTRMPDLSLYTPFVLELRNAPFRTQEQILFYILDRLPRLSGVALDARGNGQALAEYARQQYGPELVAEVMLTVGWYREHTPRVKASLEDRSSTLPKSENIMEDFRGIKLVKGVPSVPDRSIKTATGQRHYDSFVAYVLAEFAAATIEPPQEWESPVTAGTLLTSAMTRGFRL